MKNLAPIKGTQLSPEMENQYKFWMAQNSINPDKNYDMRGFYLGGLLNDPLAQTEVNQSDTQIHFPDKWKLPSHPTFSQESIYSNSKQDPYWMENLPPYKKGTWGLISPLRGLLNLEVPQ